MYFQNRLYVLHNRPSLCHINLGKVTMLLSSKQYITSLDIKRKKYVHQIQKMKGLSNYTNLHNHFGPYANHFQIVFNLVVFWLSNLGMVT
jgi:hypothetical protein